MTAEEVKEALRKRYPATMTKAGITTPGPWTTLEEYDGIDFLALAAWKGHEVTGVTRKYKYPRVAHEVKVSRSDMRTELLDPSKRSHAVWWANQFYFAVPAGLLKLDEIAFQEPPYTFADFQRTDCPDKCLKGGRGWMRRLGGKKGKVFDPETKEWVKCPTCGGKAYTEKSLVEREWPTLWVPRDAGLIEVDSRGCHVVKEAPDKPCSPLTPVEVGAIVRWTSMRPDPRHAGLVEALRAKRKEWRNLL